MRLIDADAYAAEMKTRQDACKEIYEAAREDGNEEVYDRMNCAYGVFVEAKLTLDAMPTIDAVPVVRCGECKYLTEITDYNGWCPRINDHIENFDWFCADGERKDGEHE